MDLLKHEFLKGKQDAYFDLIGDLVRQIRHYRNEVHSDEFKAAMPKLVKLEKRIQEIDLTVSGNTRNYYDEIMDELGKEAELEEKILNEINRASQAITSMLYDTEYCMDDFSYQCRSNNAVYWIEFFGYKNKKSTDGTLLVVKEVFRAVAYKFGIVFIDSSLGN